VRLRAKKNRQTGGLLFSIAACEICGWDRNIERAHILPAHKGWKLSKFNVILLCPNHHRAFDSGQLTTDELHKLGVGWLAA
jgi:predicted restriction endonuclease